MIQDTSLRSFRELQPCLPAKEKAVLDEIRKEPSTIREIATRLNWDAGSVSARIDSLLEQKLIERPIDSRTGKQTKVRCSITGKLAYLHQIKSPLPPAMKPVAPKPQTLFT